MEIPTDLKYTRDHEWIRITGDSGVVGVTAFAADSLGDVVYVDLPSEGVELAAGTTCGEIESTKSVSDLVAPVSGTVTGVNDAVVDAPEKVNADPYGDGWLYSVQIASEGDLLSAEEYRAFAEGQDA
jgi:glycine cleavage system H protein